MKESSQRIKRYIRGIFKQKSFVGIEEYKQYSLRQAMIRIKLLSSTLVVLMAYLLCVDFASVSLRENIPEVWQGNVTAHIGIFILSCAAAVISRVYLKKRQISPTAWWLIWLYILLSMLLLNYMSLVGQEIGGGSSAFVMCVLAVALICPFEPQTLTPIFIGNYVIQIIGILLLQHNPYLRTSHIINGTIAVGLALVAVYYLERSRRSSFITERALRTSEESFRKMFFADPLPVLVVRREDGRILLANQKALKFYSIREDNNQWSEQPNTFIRQENWKTILEELETQGSIQNRVLEHQHPDGQKKWVLANFEQIEYEGEPAILCEVTDITELKRMENELAFYATTDELTGVYNRRKGIDLLQQALHESKRGGPSLVVGFADLNDLKKVNDCFGHAEGDNFIYTVCDVIKSEKDAEDIIFRYGGDEFVILFRNKDERQVRQICERIRKHLRQVSDEQHKPYELDISMGLSAFDPEGEPLTADQIMKAADKESYRNKV